MRISEKFFKRRGHEVAKDLIGKKLVNSECGSAGIIVETEAYLGKEDPACHYNANGGKRDKVFEKGPATIYVYTIHGHECMNFICGSEDYPEGVLIRAIDPVKGIKGMKKRRRFQEETSLTSGPGKLTEAMDIRKESENGTTLEESSLRLLRNNLESEIYRTPRIGISEAEDWPLRYVVKGNPHISKNKERVKSNFNPKNFYKKIEME